MIERFYETNRQYIIFVIILFLIFFLLVGRLFYLKFWEGNKYEIMAEENAARLVPLHAPRGIIYDRYGKVIVTNRAVFSVFLLPIKVSEETVNILSRILNVSPKKIWAKIEKRRRHRFEPILVKDNIPLNIVSRLEERRYKLPGVVVSNRPARAYPYGKLGAHFLGYIGEITAEELMVLRLQGYRIKDIVGKDGVEKIYDRYLRGTPGGQQVEVDTYGRPVRVTKTLDPVPGTDVKLFIDLELQKVVEKALGKWHGAIAVLDPLSGEVLALASSPSVDPNIFAVPLTEEQWKKLDRRGHPFLNRALSSYPPGSTFKVITFSAVLEKEKVKIDETFTCTGTFEFEDRKATCWKEEGHGELSVFEGLVHSCNVIFYQLGMKAGIENLASYARRCGLGKITGIDLPQESAGFVPTKRWKENNYDEVWLPGDSMNMGIGQGFLQVTPVQMANLYGMIGTGKRFRPRVLKEVISRDGKIIYSTQPELIGKIPLKEETLKVLREGLQAVVKRGTGVAARIRGLAAAGKTGTAEDPPGEPHAWFDCYAPHDKPEIAIACFVERGEHGDRAAARMARAILSWYKKYRYKAKT